MLSLQPRQAARGRALCSYLLVHPDEEESDGHSSRWECAEIVRLLLDLGFGVDLIDFRNYGFLPEAQYDLALDAGINLQRLAPLFDVHTRKLLHLTTSYVRYANEAEIRRVEELEQRRSCLYAPKVMAPYCELWDRSLQVADACSLIGNRQTRATYPEHFHPKITRVTVSASRLQRVKEPQEYVPRDREFVWFFGVGAVHKGLDLVLEVFACHPQWKLNVIGNASEERDFAKIYRRELCELANIRMHGPMSPSSPAFQEIVRRCFCFVAPSCSEGISPAAATLLQVGLYPIVSRQCGIDLPPGCGMELRDCSLREIETRAQEAFTMPDAELQRQIGQMQRCAAKQYSRERFSGDMLSFLEAALAGRRL